MTISILWPFPRLHKIEESANAEDSYEEMDGLSALSSTGINTIVLDPLPYPLNPFLHQGSLLAGMDLLRTLRLLWMYRKLDVILSIGESSCFWFVQLKRLFRLRKPVIVVDPAVGPRYRMRMLVQDWILPHVERVLVYSTAQQEHLQKRYGDKIRVDFLHHRINTGFFDRARLKGKELVPNGHAVISVGGDISRDFETLCKSAVGLEEGVAIYTRRSIQATIPDNVCVIRDWISYPELRRRYQQARLIVVPLHEAIHPSGINALLEAMAMGKPVIVSASAGVQDYVIHGKTAWVVPAEDPGALREAIVHLLKHHELAEELGCNARRFCEATCALPVYGQKVASIVKGIH